MFRSQEGKECPPGEIDLGTEKILMMLRDLDEEKRGRFYKEIAQGSCPGDEGKLDPI